jgi:hypothetical protein
MIARTGRLHVDPVGLTELQIENPVHEVRGDAGWWCTGVA